MEFHIDTEDDIKILRFYGDLVAGKLYSVKEKVNELLKEDNPKIIFDFSDINFVDSSGVGLLISSLKILSGKKYGLKLVNINDTVQSVLKQMQIYSLFEVFDSIDEAVESFSE